MTVRYCVLGLRWEDQQAMYIGLRYPEDRKKRKRRKHSRIKTGDTAASADASIKQCTHQLDYGFPKVLNDLVYANGEVLGSCNTVWCDICGDLKVASDEKHVGRHFGRLKPL